MRILMFLGLTCTSIVALIVIGQILMRQVVLRCGWYRIESFESEWYGKEKNLPCQLGEAFWLSITGGNNAK
jgi:hypothetical protein